MTVYINNNVECLCGLFLFGTSEEISIADIEPTGAFWRRIEAKLMKLGFRMEIESSHAAWNGGYLYPNRTAWYGRVMAVPFYYGVRIPKDTEKALDAIAATIMAEYEANLAEHEANLDKIGDE